MLVRDRAVLTAFPEQAPRYETHGPVRVYRSARAVQALKAQGGDRPRPAGKKPPKVLKLKKHRPAKPAAVTLNVTISMPVYLVLDPKLDAIAFEESRAYYGYTRARRPF